MDVTGTDNADLINADDGVTEGTDRIWGLGGDDSIYGLGGDDFIVGGAGADYLDGGDGVDHIDYSESASAVFASLLSSSGVGGDANGDIYFSIEGIIGSPFDDFLIGDDNGNFINGIDGNNTVQGKGGNDTLNAYFGNDTMSGGDGADRIFSSSGNDSLEGGAGNDDLDANTGNDTIEGGDDNDTLTGGADADSLNGGNGNDTADYSFGGGAGLTISLTAGTASDGDTLTEIENVIGSFGSDTIIGDAIANSLAGGSGNDVIKGRGGSDTLVGDIGNDTLEGGADADQLIGGDGKDSASYAGSNAAVKIDLTLGTASGGHAAGDVLTEIEGVIGSKFNDQLTGNATANTLNGMNGRDTLRGSDGSDTLKGGNGDDLLVGGKGGDVLNGGDGIDTANYVASKAAVNVNLLSKNAAGGEAQGDKLASIESITGSSFGDFLVGDDVANTLNGFDGDDFLLGNGGRDVLTGGRGLDQLTGGNGKDVFDFNRIAESGHTAATADLILDFDSNAVDKIDLKTIDAVAGGSDDAFIFRSTGAFTGVGQVRYFNQGGDTFVALNTTGDITPDMLIKLDGLITLDTTDFIL